MMKYYFCPKQIASHAPHERKAATYVHTQQALYLTVGCGVQHMYMICIYVAQLT